MKVHLVFHTTWLRPAASDPLPRQHHDPPLPIVVQGEEEWFIDETVDSRKNKRKKNQLEYKVKYTGYDEATQQLASDVQSAQEALQDFHRKYPSKPKPKDFVIKDLQELEA